MGSSQTKDKSISPSEKIVEGLKDKVRVLQSEINEIMCLREREREVYEREVMVFALKGDEWKREKKRLKEEVKKLRKILDEKEEKVEGWGFWGVIENIKVEQARRDEALKKWKQLYFAIKVELDDLIQRTHQEERLCWKKEEEDVLMEVKKEMRAKEERIEILQAKLMSMENQESKREREMDILRQSLRIMSHKKKRATKIVHRGL